MSEFQNLNDYQVVREIESSLLDQLKIVYEKEKSISDEILESLYYVYKAPLLEALNQIDKQDQSDKTASLVTLMKSVSSSRSVYQVKGSMGLNYYLFDDHINFCTCSSFKYNVLNKFEYICCKHVILVKLLVAMNKVPVKMIKDVELADLIKQIQ